MKEKEFNSEEFTNENILCEECEKALITGLKSESSDLIYCLDCVLVNVLIKARIRYKNMLTKNEGRYEK